MSAPWYLLVPAYMVGCAIGLALQIAWSNRSKPSELETFPYDPERVVVVGDLTDAEIDRLIIEMEANAKSREHAATLAAMVADITDKPQYSELQATCDELTKRMERDQ